jgi:DNA sulfur modification protein DndE
MYDEGYFFVPNSFNRYTLSSRFDFKYNKDGSLDFFIQKDNPGKDKEANWLPAPEGGFILMFRFYWPEQAILDGSWKLPEVKNAGS